jgi:hypothetical protein
MVDKCANPSCSAPPFRSLREGRMFVMEAEGDSCIRGNGRSQQPRYSWLCNACCETMTVVAEKKEGIKVVPLPTSASAARPAS